MVGQSRRHRRFCRHQSLSCFDHLSSIAHLPNKYNPEAIGRLLRSFAYRKTPYIFFTVVGYPQVLVGGSLQGRFFRRKLHSCFSSTALKWKQINKKMLFALLDIDLFVEWCASFFSWNVNNSYRIDRLVSPKKRCNESKWYGTWGAKSGFLFSHISYFCSKISSHFIVIFQIPKANPFDIFIHQCLFEFCACQSKAIILSSVCAMTFSILQLVIYALDDRA